MFGGFNLSDTAETRAAFLRRGRLARGLTIQKTARRLEIDPFELKRAEAATYDLPSLMFYRAEEFFRIGDYHSFAARIFQSRISGTLSDENASTNSLNSGSVVLMECVRRARASRS